MDDWITASDWRTRDPPLCWKERGTRDDFFTEVRLTTAQAVFP